MLIKQHGAQDTRIQRSDRAESTRRHEPDLGLADSAAVHSVLGGASYRAAGAGHGGVRRDRSAGARECSRPRKTTGRCAGGPGRGRRDPSSHLRG